MGVLLKRWHLTKIRLPSKKEISEPEIGTVCSYKRDEDLKNISANVIHHKLTDEQLILSVRPLVDAFFAWVKANQHKVPGKSETIPLF